MQGARTAETNTSIMEPWPRLECRLRGWGDSARESAGPVECPLFDVTNDLRIGACLRSWWIVDRQT